jgi:hypothetical protein
LGEWPDATRSSSQALAFAHRSKAEITPICAGVRMSETLIYFLKPVGMVGPIKIGSSWKPVDRMRTFMSWSPFPLELIATTDGDGKLERTIHNCFADAHSHCEWFHPIPRLLKAIEDIKIGMPVSEAIDLSNRRGNVLGRTQRMTREANGTVYGAMQNAKYPRTETRKKVMDAIRAGEAA